MPRPDDERSFAERMTVRVAPHAAIHDPTSPYRPHLKAAHRADPAITVSFGSHTGRRALAGGRLHNWHPADVLHFPVPLARAVGEQGRPPRARRQAARVSTSRRSGRRRAGGAPTRFRALVVDDAALEQGLAAGSLRVDTRLRDALRAQTAPHAAEPDQVSVISDSVAVREADIVRLRRYLDRMAVRVGALEDG